MIFMGILVTICMTILGISLQRRLATSWLHRYQQHTATPSTTHNYSKQTANDIHDLHNLPNHGIYGRQLGYGWTEVQCSVQL